MSDTTELRTRKLAAVSKDIHRAELVLELLNALKPHVPAGYEEVFAQSLLAPAQRRKSTAIGKETFWADENAVNGWLGR